MKDKAKKISYRKIFLRLFVLILAVFFWRVNQRYVIAQGERDNGLGKIYKYKVENYSFRYAMRITIWEEIRVNDFISYPKTKLDYVEGSLTVDRVGKTEWINSGNGIYLKLDITYHDSIESTNPTRIIYDFAQDQIYVSSDLTLWRNHNDFKWWMSEKEFDKILAELRQ